MTVMIISLFLFRKLFRENKIHIFIIKNKEAFSVKF